MECIALDDGFSERTRYDLATFARIWRRVNTILRCQLQRWREHSVFWDMCLFSLLLEDKLADAESGLLGCSWCSADFG